MTALIARDRMHPYPERLAVLLPRESALDRRLMRPALILALAAHGLALLLPLPSLVGGVDAIQPPAPPPDDPPVVIRLDQVLRAPAVTLRRTDRPIPGRRAEVESNVAPDLDPEVATFEGAGELQAEVGDIEILSGAIAGPPPSVFHDGLPGLVLPQLASDRLRPEYPEIARVTRREGRVILSAVVTEEGDVASVEVLQAPDPDLGFSDAAIAAVSRWQYAPGLYRGRPVAVELTVVIDFTLNP